MLLLLALLIPLYAHALDPVATAPVPPSAAPANVMDPEAACEEAEKMLEQHAASFRVNCAHDKDCGAYQRSQSPCAAPIVIRKSGDLVRDKELRALQAKSSELCSTAWAKRSACARPKPRPVCREGKCEDGGSLPGSVK